MTADALAGPGAWIPDGEAPAFTPEALFPLIRDIRQPLFVLRDGPQGGVGLASRGRADWCSETPPRYPLVGLAPPLYPEWLGDRSFCEVHGVRFPYVAGAMANGIASPELVVAMARARMLAFFGAGGLSLAAVERGLDAIEAGLVGVRGAVFGANLIYSPAEPRLEEAVADLYLRRGVRRISASAYMRLTPAVVRLAASGLHLDPSGRLIRQQHLFAKISRPEVAQLFMSPPPPTILSALVASTLLTPAEAELASRVPLCEDITVEADSGGHTDNRPLSVILPTILLLRDQLVATHAIPRPIRVGAAGGLGTPSAVAAAFSLGAAYVLTGSVNQAAVESGLSAEGKTMLAEAGVADMAMAPSLDMFELGVKVQVLRRGTLFASRASMLSQLYGKYHSLEEIPEVERHQLEKDIFRDSLENIWTQTQAFFKERNPSELDQALARPRHRMALVFRWYLGRSSRWAIEGRSDRRLDYQIWCGPAMGAFNAWAKGSFLEDPKKRHVVQIALNLLEGAAVATRAQQLRGHGVPVPPAAFAFRPRPLRVHEAASDDSAAETPSATCGGPAGQ